MSCSLEVLWSWGMTFTSRMDYRLNRAPDTHMSRYHRKLDAFHLRDSLVIGVYRATQTFPSDERFGLISQIRRASVSAASTIVEGCGRSTEQELIRYLDMSLGSLREVGYYLDLAVRLEFLSPEAARP